MTKRNTTNIIYFGMIISTLILRMSMSLGLSEAMGVDSQVLFSITVQVLIFGVFAIAGYLIGQKQDGIGRIKGLCIDFGIKKCSFGTFMRCILVGICMITVTGYLSYAWQNILALMGYTHTSSPTIYSSIEMLIVQIILVCMLPGFFEEISHRGLIYAGYKNTGWRFVLVSAILFSLMHQNIVQTGYAFFAGLVIALIMYYTSSIWPCIFVHFFNNFVNILTSYSSQNGGPFSFLVTIDNFFYSSVMGIFVLGIVSAVALVIMALTFSSMRKNAVIMGIIPEKMFYMGNKNALPLRKDFIFIVTLLVGICATVFSLVWGILR